LKDLFQIDAPVWRGYDVERADYSINAKNEQILNMIPKKNIINKGRVVYLPEIKPSIAKPSGVGMTNRYWKLPKNYEEILELVKWAAKDNLSLMVKAPVYVTAELTKSIDKSKIMLHLVNYNNKRNALVTNIEVSMEIPAGLKPKQVNVFSPDMKEIQSLPYEISQNRINFIVQQLNVYDLVVLELD
jgi:hypothetical protein